MTYDPCVPLPSLASGARIAAGPPPSSTSPSGATLSSGEKLFLSVPGSVAKDVFRLGAGVGSLFLTEGDTPDALRGRTPRTSEAEGVGALHAHTLFDPPSYTPLFPPQLRPRTEGKVGGSPGPGR